MCASFVNSLSDATLGTSPPLVIDGIVSAKFTYALLSRHLEYCYSHLSDLSYIPVHLEYILTEILKNAVRASVEHHQATHSTGPLPPVQVTIAPSSTFVSLRIRDQGGGIHPNSLPRVFSYAFTTAGRNAEIFDPDYDEGSGDGPYAAQQMGGSAAIANDGNSDDAPAFFGEMASKGLQTGLGTIAGLGYGWVVTCMLIKELKDSSIVLCQSSSCKVICQLFRGST